MWVQNWRSVNVSLSRGAGLSDMRFLSLVLLDNGVGLRELLGKLSCRPIMCASSLAVARPFILNFENIVLWQHEGHCLRVDQETYELPRSTEGLGYISLCLGQIRDSREYLSRSLSASGSSLGILPLATCHPSIL